MKKKILAIALLGIFTLSIVGCIKIGVKDKSGKNINETYLIKDIKNIEIKGDAIDLSVVGSDREDISVVGNIGNNGSYNSQVSNGKVKIESKFEEISVVGFNSDNVSKLTIEIPNKYLGDLDLNFGAGEVDVKDISVKNFTLKGGAGDVQVDNIKFDYLDYKGGAGNFDMDVETLGELSLKAGVGDTSVRCNKEVKGNASIKGGVGNVTLHVPNNSPINFDASNGLGDVKLNAKTSGENKFLFKIQGGIGNITVN